MRVYEYNVLCVPCMRMCHLSVWMCACNFWFLKIRIFWYCVVRKKNWLPFSDRAKKETPLLRPLDHYYYMCIYIIIIIIIVYYTLLLFVLETKKKFMIRRQDIGSDSVYFFFAKWPTTRREIWAENLFPCSAHNYYNVINIRGVIKILLLVGREGDYYSVRERWKKFKIKKLHLHTLL